MQSKRRSGLCASSHEEGKPCSISVSLVQTKDEHVLMEVHPQHPAPPRHHPVRLYQNWVHIGCFLQLASRPSPPV